MHTLRPDIARPATVSKAVSACESTSLLIAASVRQNFVVFSLTELVWLAESVIRVDESDQDTDVEVDVGVG